MVLASLAASQPPPALPMPHHIVSSPQASDGLREADVLRSFRHEASLLRRLAHPNIVALRHAQVRAVFWTVLWYWYSIWGASHRSEGIGCLSPLQLFPA